MQKSILFLIAMILAVAVAKTNPVAACVAVFVVCALLAPRVAGRLSINILESLTAQVSNVLNTLKTGFEELKTALATKATLEIENTELKATVKRQEQEIAGLKLENAKTADLQRDNQNFAADIAAKDAKIIDLEKAAKSVGQAAAELTAAQGVPAASLPAGAGDKSKNDLMAQFKAITDPQERAEFYAKHKDQLLS